MKTTDLIAALAEAHVSGIREVSMEITTDGEVMGDVAVRIEGNRAVLMWAGANDRGGSHVEQEPEHYPGYRHRLRVIDGGR
jgi:hypothetical protein